MPSLNVYTHAHVKIQHTKLLKIVAWIVLIIRDIWVDRIELRCARRHARGSLCCQLAWIIAPAKLYMLVPPVWLQK